MLKNGKLICKEARIENTNRCNAACAICPREKMTRPKCTMPYRHFVFLVDQLMDLGVTDISIFGFGEPLLDSGVIRKVDHCSQLGLTTHITTNASRLDLNMANNLLDAGLNNIRFSFHALHAVDYERVHKGLNWIDTMRNMANFVQLAKRKGNCTTHLTCIPMDGQEVEVIRKTWERIFDHLEIWAPHNWGEGRNYREVRPNKKTCGRPSSGPFQVQADGRVIPCCFLTNAEIILGDTYKDRIIDILTGEDYARLQNAHESGELGNLPCAVCDQRNGDSEGILLYSNRDAEKKLNRLSTSKADVCLK